MKCTNCGKNEVSFTYTSNINGKITRQQLCGECAQKLGYADSLSSMFSRSERMMSRMMDGFFGRSLMPFTAFGLPDSDFFALPGIERGEQAEKAPEGEQACSCEGNAAADTTAADPELSRRRRINALRRQMHEAADREDYESAAKLRNQLRQLEG